MALPHSFALSQCLSLAPPCPNFCPMSQNSLFNCHRKAPLPSIRSCRPTAIHFFGAPTMCHRLQNGARIKNAWHLLSMQGCGHQGGAHMNIPTHTLHARVCTHCGPGGGGSAGKEAQRALASVTGRGPLVGSQGGRESDSLGGMRLELGFDGWVRTGGWYSGVRVGLLCAKAEKQEGEERDTS